MNKSIKAYKRELPQIRILDVITDEFKMMWIVGDLADKQYITFFDIDENWKYRFEIHDANTLLHMEEHHHDTEDLKFLGYFTKDTRIIVWDLMSGEMIYDFKPVELKIEAV